MRQRLFIFISLFFLSLAGEAKQPGESRILKAYEDSLRRLDSAIFLGKDQQKKAANEKFIAYLRKALSAEGAFDYPFDSLKTIARLTAPDNAFRIFNWNVPNDDGTYLYYGFLLVNEAKVKETRGKGKALARDHYVLYELVDKSAEIRNPEIATLSPDKWYGALYYRIIKTTDKSKNYYTLLGWDGNTPMTWKKLIDVLSFDKQGNPVFGEKNLFQRHGQRAGAKRVIFEFRAELVMTLRWEEDNKRIVFDRLAPEVGGAEGMYQFYSQTFVYDAFVWKKGKWTEKEDVPAKNDKNKNDDKWIKPQGDQTPGGSSDGANTGGKK